MTALSVNINKIATLRNARGKHRPHLVNFAEELISLGVKSITIHPRPDQRHITRTDVYDLANMIAHTSPHVEFNIEGYPSPDFIALINELRPTQCTLVPDGPEAITSNAGWNIYAQHELLARARKELPRQTRVSLFIDPFDYLGKEHDAAKTIAQLNVARIELYTEAYADAFATPEQSAMVQVYKKCAEVCREHGLGINAGHDLDLENLPYFLQNVAQVDEVSIGHAFISDCLYWGVKETMAKYQEATQR